MGPQRAVLVVSLTNKRKICHPPQREVLFAYFNFSLSPTPPSTRTSRCIVEKFVTLLKEKFSLPISTKGSLCLLNSELHKHSPPQREVLFAYFNFSLSPIPPSTRTSRCMVEKFVTPLKEKFSLPISIFDSLLPHRQRQLLVVSLKNLSPPSKRSSLCLFQFFTLSSPTLNERFSLSRVQRDQRALPTSKRSSLCIFEFFTLSPLLP